MTSRVGIYPGTFDPITYGHMDIISRALHVVDKLVIAIAQDTAKTPMFSLEQRQELVRLSIESLSTPKRERVEIHCFHGLTVNFAKEVGASIIIRGLRAVSDYEYEFQMSGMNAKLAKDIETVFLPASESTQFISSRFVKQIAHLGGDISPFVPKHVAYALASL